MALRVDSVQATRESATVHVDAVTRLVEEFETWHEYVRVDHLVRRWNGLLARTWNVARISASDPQRPGYIAVPDSMQGLRKRAITRSDKPAELKRAMRVSWGLEAYLQPDGTGAEGIGTLNPDGSLTIVISEAKCEEFAKTVGDELCLKAIVDGLAVDPVQLRVPAAVFMQRKSSGVEES